MTRFCKYLRFGLAAGFLSTVMAGTSRAGILEIDLTVGFTVIQIQQGGFYDISADPDVITVDTTKLNATLVTTGHGNLTFADLGVTSNNPGEPTGSSLGQAGTALVSSGTVSFSLVAFQTDFLIPTGSSGVLSSASGGTFTKTNAGNNTTFQSYYNGANDGLIAGSTPSPISTYPAPTTNQPVGYGETAPNTPLAAVTAPYGLINQITVSLTGTPTRVGKDQFTGSTVVTAVAIPEPASAVVMMSALPIAFALIRRYRRSVKVMA